MSGKKEMGKSYMSSDPLIRYTCEHSLRLTAEQRELADATVKAPHGGMLAAPEVSQFNQNMLRSINAKRALEVGLFSGYNALSMALALPHDGVVIGMDVSPDMYEQYGRPLAKRAGVEHKIRTHYAPAVETLNKLIKDGTCGTWDYCFIDADKGNYGNYYELCLQLLRPGGIIAIDNTIWHGRVTMNPAEMDGGTRAIHELNVAIGKDDRVNVSFLTMGDGLMLAFKK